MSTWPKDLGKTQEAFHFCCKKIGCIKERLHQLSKLLEWNGKKLINLFGNIKFMSPSLCLGIMHSASLEMKNRNGEKLAVFTISYLDIVECQAKEKLDFDV